MIADEYADAVPKKRGPKTDVLEALMKRVDGLEKRLKDEKKNNSPVNNDSGSSAPEESTDHDAKLPAPLLETIVVEETAVYSPSPPRYVTITNFAPLRFCIDENQ
jgi:hypothetical protein